MSSFDEKTLCSQIAARLAEAGRPAISDDEILNIVDMIWDFYDSRGYLDPDNDSEASREELEPEILQYCLTMLRRDKKAKVTPDDLPIIIAAELDYEDQLLEGDEGLDDLDSLLSD